MKKFLVLCLTILLLSFTLLAAGVDLKSNLTFTFEPSSMTKKSLVIIPFADLDLILVQDQEKTVEKKKESDLPMIFGIWVMMVIQFTLLY